MAAPRTDAFLAPEIRLAAACRALGHPARVAILKTLAREGRATCGELVDVLPLAQSTVSQHLKALRTAGLIRGTEDGPRVYYAVDPDGIGAFRGALSFLLARLDAVTP